MECGVRVAQSLVFCVVFYRSFFFLLYFFFRIPVKRGVLNTALCDKVLSVTCDRTVVFSGHSTNNSDCHDIVEILLKVALNGINHKQSFGHCIVCP